ncbi:FecR family protein [Terrihabitans sp. B22-R8]|uniref:FecR family protein n=1 Tax=Terrihabitans sp. B22-R8 TaxID=3425128 RepID=UPI00403CFF5F
MPEPQDADLEQAAEWYFRQDGRALSAQERARFEAWLDDPGHRAAYAEIEQTWAEAGGLAAPRVQRPVLSGAFRIAASLIIVAFGAAYALDFPTRLRADAYTMSGEWQTVTLPDGSSADINTSSAIQLAFGPGERRVRLLKGEAVFTVAKDATRPFVVEADGDVATALGTVFAVRETGEGAVVTVLESRVAVAFQHGGPERQLGPGEQVRPLGGSHEVTAVDADAATAWRRGKLIFSDRTLGSVVAEISRYHPGLIRIVDPSLEKLRVSGVFDATDPLGVVGALEDSLGITSTRLGSAVVLLHH